jgi:hypothetical protein
VGEEFEKVLRIAQEEQPAPLDIERLWQRLVSDLESYSELFVPVEVMQAALSCLDRHGRIDSRLQQAVDGFTQRTHAGDYAVAFNDKCTETHENLYIDVPGNAVCSLSTEDLIRRVKPYGLYYARRRASELWASPEVSPTRVASLLAGYVEEFPKARASDDGVATILSDMLAYGYLDELCQVASASRARAACVATSEARKVVAAELALARSMGVAEFALVSFLAQSLVGHKMFCLREYNRKESSRRAAELSRLTDERDVDRNEFGDIQQWRSLTPLRPLDTEPDKSDLAVLKRPYWLYCEKDSDRHWVGDHAYHNLIISYTSDDARRLRFEDEAEWRKVDLEIAAGRLRSFTWHSAAESFIEVQRATGVTVLAPPAQEPPGLPIETVEPPIAPSTPVVTGPGEEQARTRRVGYTLESIADKLRHEQDAVMRTSPVGITLIAGAAGSGKTNVAFHRLDYLLQEHSNHFSADNIAVFAPRVALATYLRALAESFQFWRLPIYSYGEWVMGVLSRFTDANRVGAEEGWELSRRKSCAGMLDLIRRYLSDKVYALKAEAQSDSRLQGYSETIDSVFQRPLSSLMRTYTAMRDALWQAIDARHGSDEEAINGSRASVESSLMQLLHERQNEASLVDDVEDLLRVTFRAFPGFKKEYAAISARLEVYSQPPSLLQRLIWSRGAVLERTAKIEAVLMPFVELMFSEKKVPLLVSRRIRSEKNRVNARLRAIFNRVCFISIYAHAPADLASICETPFLLHIFAMLTEFYRSPRCWEYLGLTESPEHPFQAFELSRADVDVAMWLIHQISSENLAKEPTASFLHVYDHVLVDEAHDFTPLQLLLLHRLSRNSMTLAGDLTQRIFAAGIRDWDELGEPIDNRYVLTMSHRATLETTLFANALMLAASSATLAERVAYRGDRPLIMRCRDEDSAVAAAVEYIARVKTSASETSVLLVHPRNAALKGLRERLATVGVTGYVAKGDTWEFSEKVAVTTYLRVQGLEYDYVVVLGLNEFESMLMSGDKQRILYTIATRARRRLVLCVTESIPALLAGVDSSLYDLSEA